MTTLADRLRSRMRWRGIRSQSQLARLSGVSQSSIHYILALGDGYDATRDTVRRLAAALGTTPAWLGGDDNTPPKLHDPGIAYAPDGYDAELQALMARLPTSARRKVVDIVRLIVEGGSPDKDQEDKQAHPGNSPTSPAPPAASRPSP
jgi:transcriptional regulator with XRE-family HTH domain